jgi:hypothetical protein
MLQDGDERSCIHTDESGKPCDGKQTFKRSAKPPGWHTGHALEQSGWKCDKNPEHFDKM